MTLLLQSRSPVGLVRLFSPRLPGGRQVPRLRLSVVAGTIPEFSPEGFERC